MTATSAPWLAIIPLVAVCIVALIGLINIAKKFLDNDKDYQTKVDEVIQINRIAARTRLGWVADDFSNPQSQYSMSTLVSEEYVFRETKVLGSFVQSIKKCRRCMKRARIGHEIVIWCAIAGFVLAPLYILSNALPSARFATTPLACLGGGSVALAIGAFVFAENSLRIIRSHHAKCKDLDAAVPS